MADFHRETAHRVFAQEFRDTRVQIEGEGEKDPNFVVTPLGAKINRLHVVGVCTEAEPVGEQGDLWRARISDPTGVFTVYAGQYQPEAARVISELQPPAFVSVTGKARTYEPEPGSFFVSIRPESVRTVDEATRDQWIVDTARRTAERIEEVRSAGPDAPADGTAGLAQTHYGLLEVGKYEETVENALTGLIGGEVQVHRIEAKEEPAGFAGTGDAPTWTPPTPAEPKADPQAEAANEAVDDDILGIVTRLEGDKGAQWDAILAEAESATVTSEDVEESLNRLMDKGLVYEPTLGVLKTT